MYNDSKKNAKPALKQVRQLIEHFCSQERLPGTYKLMAEKYFIPLAYEIWEAAEARAAKKPFVVGINGAQGSGKSTLALLLSTILQSLFNQRIANLSIDDFYHTKYQRQQMANSTHPLLQTRGVPGTHDIYLLNTVLQTISSNNGRVYIPRFDKSIDDRYPEDAWDTIQTPTDIIILEGWCLGVRPQSAEQLDEPINTLEQQEDKHGIWRNYVNQSISKHYLPLSEKLDTLIMLKAPNFDCVYQWRQKQEDRLKQKIEDSNEDSSDNRHAMMNHLQLRRFIQHFQRLTIDMLDVLPKHADTIFNLNTDHTIHNCLKHNSGRA